MLKTASKLLVFLNHRARLHFALLAIPMLLTALLEMASIGMILPVIQVVLQGNTDGWYTKILFAIVPVSADSPNAGLWIAAIFAGFFVVKNLTLLGLIYTVNSVIEFRKAAFLSYMYGIYLSRPLTFHYRNNSALILRNLISGCGHVFECVRVVLMMSLECLLVIATIGLLLAIQPTATLITAGALGIMAILFYLVVGRIFHRWGERAMRLDGELIKWINQSFTSIRDVKLSHAYDYLNRSISGITQSRADISRRVSTTTQIPRFMIESVIVVGFIVLMLLLLVMEEKTTDVVGLLGLFGMAGLRLMPSLNRLLTGATDLRQRAAYIENLYTDLTEGLVDRDRTEHDPDSHAITFARELRLEGVSYLYEGTTEKALHDIQLSITKGESIGVVGPSGAGKSTLIDVILGFLPPQSGRILLDDVDVFENLRGWQRQIGCVPQQVALIDDTLRRNIAFALDDGEISETRLATVIKMSHLDDVIARLPDGLDTMIGEHGVRLSGGQRQRIAIARALYHDPSTLIFDEATSALDHETEHEINRAVEDLAGEKTVIVIAHRLSTVRNCDKLILMKQGRIAAIGSYDDLLETSEDFRRLADVMTPELAETL